MTSGTPASQPEQQPPAMAVPMARTPWWRRWLEPVMVVTIIIALFTALVTGEVAVFQSVKDDVRAAETRISERMDRIGESIQASEAKLHGEIQASEARQNKRIDELKADLKQDNVELKADLKAMDNKLDRVLEALPAAKA